MIFQSAKGHQGVIYSKVLYSPLVQRKAGFSKEVLGGDPNGFLHGLLYDEGTSWQINRKRLGKQFHLGILESYIEVSHLLLVENGLHPNWTQTSLIQTR